MSLITLIGMAIALAFGQPALIVLIAGAAVQPALSTVLSLSTINLATCAEVGFLCAVYCATPLASEVPLMNTIIVLSHGLTGVLALTLIIVTGPVATRAD